MNDESAIRAAMRAQRCPIGMYCYRDEGCGDKGCPGHPQNQLRDFAPDEAPAPGYARAVLWIVVCLAAAIAATLFIASGTP